MPVPAILYVYCCESPAKPTHQVGRFYHLSFQNCYIAAIGEKNRQVCPHQSVAKIACDFRWRSNSPRSAYKIARCVAGLKLPSVTNRATTERRSHAFHTEPIFATSRTDQSILRYPRQFFQKKCKSTRFQSFEHFFFFFWGGGGVGDLFREILAFLRRVKCAPD